MADQGVSEYWGDKHKPFVPAWTNDEELASLADAIVRGAAMCHAIIPNLRQLIEAVQAHSDARLAEVGRDGKPTIDKPTALRVHGGEVVVCDCSAIAIKLRLTAPTRLAGRANFDKATVVGRLNFGGAAFVRDAKFDGAVFVDEVSFWNGTFVGDASFRRTHFGRNLVFRSVCVTGDAHFWGARFEKFVYFEKTSFLRGAGFAEAVFSNDAHFEQTFFNFGAHFWRAQFLGDASFVRAVVTDCAHFWRTRFVGEACFEQVSFTGIADFGQTTFVGNARFDKTHFNNRAHFQQASFTSDLHFEKAMFADDASFCEITLNGRLRLNHSIFGPSSRVAFSNSCFRPGSEVALPFDRTMEMRVFDWLTTDRNKWFSELWCRDNDHVRRVWIWFVQFCFVAAIAPIVEFEWKWPRKVLGMGACGTLIKGEDSDDPCELGSAGEQYSLLRDNLRAQASQVELEDQCHFRHMDLRRMAGDLYGQSHPWRPLRWCANAYYWLVWRNCLGYLVRPMRPLVTASVVILIWTGLYVIGASADTILYNGTLADNEAAIDKWKDGFLTPLYFSVTTFTTLGYGDFAPTGWLRAVAGVQAILGVGLIALFTVSWGRKMIR